MFKQSRLLVFLLSLALVFGVIMPVTAAEVDFRYDALTSEFSIRGQQAPLFVEVPFAEANYYGDDNPEKVWGLSGFNAGLKGPRFSPFYMKMQFNWERASTDTQDYNEDQYFFSSPEIGIGGVYDAWGYTSFGAELSIIDPTIKNIDQTSISFEVFFKYYLDDLLGLETNSEP